MKFVVSSALLAARLATVGRVIVQKNNIPILDCFRFDIRGGKLSIMASDGDSTLTSELELNESDGEALFAVNAKTLQDAIKEIPEQPLEFYLNTDTLELVVDYQNGQYKLLAQAADEYPTAPEGEGEFVSPAALAVGEARMSVKVPDAEWWQTEFTLQDGANIFYRENNAINSNWNDDMGSGYSVQLAPGNKVRLNFSTGTGSVE